MVAINRARLFTMCTSLTNDNNCGITAQRKHSLQSETNQNCRAYITHRLKQSDIEHIGAANEETMKLNNQSRGELKVRSNGPSSSNYISQLADSTRGGSAPAHAPLSASHACPTVVCGLVRPDVHVMTVHEGEPPLLKSRTAHVRVTTVSGRNKTDANDER